MRRVTTASGVAVAGVAALASYEHMRALAALAREGWRSWRKDFELMFERTATRDS